MIRSFPERTKARINRLQQYMSKNVLANRTFICRHFNACRASRADAVFYEGQLSHVGAHYDLEIDDRPVRIVFAGQEYGHAPSRVGLEERSKMIAEVGTERFLSVRRNPHMRGTASTLRLLFGREPGSDDEGERLIDGVHIFEGFALVNYLLCSATKEPRDEIGEDFRGAAKGNSSPTMRRNCQDHFVRTLEILEPTVIVVQGQGVRQWMAKGLGLPPRGPTREQALIGGQPVDLLTFDHPSAPGKSGWWGRSPYSKYLTETVAPAIKAYVRSVAGQSPDTDSGRSEYQARI
jgi:uracil-DNA glycosylase